MKAIEEIGLKKTIIFTLYCFVQAFYTSLYFPPLRKFFLTFFGAKIGKDSVIMNVKFFNWHHTGLKGFTVGKECFIGDETLIDLENKVILEDQVTLAQRVTVLTHLNVGYKSHPLQKFFPRESQKVIFKSRCAVGANVTILPGVIIGKEAFVAAGSVVTKNVPARTLVAGVPAKPVRKIE